MFASVIPAFQCLSRQQKTQLNNAVAKLENDGLSKSLTDLTAYVPAGCDETLHGRILVELIKVDQELSLRAGKLRPTEEYQSAWPAIGQNSLLLGEIVSAECWTRTFDGDKPSREEIAERFPAVVDQVDWEELNAEFGQIGREATYMQQTKVASEGDTRGVMTVGEELAPDSQIGKYRIEERVGEGAMGIVYRAVDNELKRDVALKAPFLEEGINSPTGKQFRREAVAMAAVKHSNTCPVYEILEHDHHLYLVMAFIIGPSLEERIKQREIDQYTAAHLILKLANGLQAIHDAGIIHRDVKTANVMLEKGDEPVLTDFGLAHSHGSDFTLSGNESLFGTPAFMSPEQAKGDPSVDHRTDIYSLGVVFYQLLAGKLPFTGPLGSVLSAIQTQDPARPSELVDGIDSRLESVCLRAMARDRDQRFSTAADLAKALGDSLTDERQTGVLKRTSNDSERSGIRRATIGAAIVAIAVLGFGIRLKTGNGYLKINNIPADAEVIVEEDGVVITSEGGRYQFEVGEHQVVVRVGSQEEERTFKISWRGEVEELSLNFGGVDDNDIQPNIALASYGTKATSDSVSEPHRGPERAIDGDEKVEGWDGRDASNGWWQAEFPVVHLINKVDVAWNTHQHKFSIQVSTDGEIWQSVVAEQMSNNKINERSKASYEFQEVSARFVRINILSTSAPTTHLRQASIVQVAIYESPNAPPLINNDFDSSLVGWKVFCADEDSLGVTPGTIEWSDKHGGSAISVVRGTPSSVDFSQTLHRELPAGSTITFEVEKAAEANSGWYAYLGDPTQKILEAEQTKGRSTVSWTTPERVPVGTPLTLHFGCWPGEATFVVKNVEVAIPN